jgi:hypothetical protein
MSVIENAPYVYLAKHTAEPKYHLFTRVFIAAANRVINWGAPIYTNGATLIQGTIVAGASPAGNYDNHYIELTPDGRGYTFDTAFEIIITVLNADMTQRRTTVFYADSDTVDIDNESIVAGIARNCPYLYLSNPESLAGGDDKKFRPRCMVPTLGYTLIDQQLVLTTADSGICEQQIELINDGSAASFIPTGSIQANAIIEYFENPPVEGHFGVQVFLTDPGISSIGGINTAMQLAANFNSYRGPESAANRVSATRRGRLRNKSSDPNPTGFIS